MFHLNHGRNGNDDISSEEHFGKFENQERFFFITFDPLVFDQELFHSLPIYKKVNNFSASLCNFAVNPG